MGGLLLGEDGQEKVDKVGAGLSMFFGPCDGIAE